MFETMAGQATLPHDSILVWDPPHFASPVLGALAVVVVVVVVVLAVTRGRARHSRDRPRLRGGAARAGLGPLG